MGGGGKKRIGVRGWWGKKRRGERERGREWKKQSRKVIVSILEVVKK